MSVTQKDDVPAEWHVSIGKTQDEAKALCIPEVILSPKGLPAQRNAGLKLVIDDSDIVVFFDDDYIPSIYALEGIARAFEIYPELSGLTGKLVSDGIGGPGIDPADAVALIETWDANPNALSGITKPKKLADRRGLYGCNMAFRTSRIGDIRFDERLPLYGWLEDIDFSSRIPGSKIVTDALVGVHCGVKRGRELRGDMLGYSQIANPFYLWKKGSIKARFGLKLAARNMLSNHARVFWAEPWVDRKGRARGNWRAIKDIILAKSAPEKILNFR